MQTNDDALIAMTYRGVRHGPIDVQGDRHNLYSAFTPRSFAPYHPIAVAGHGAEDCKLQSA